MKHLAPLFLATCCTAALHAQTVELERVLSGLNDPVDIAHAGDARLFIVERPGVIRILQPNGHLASAPFLDITTRVLSTGSEQGLLGLAFDPQYATTGAFYVYYTAGTGNGTLRLSRFTVSGDPMVANASSEAILWSLAKPYTNHNGGDLAFGPDGYLYFAPGDGGDGGDPGNRAQDLTTAFGKVLRIDVHSGSPYGIPPTNPYATSNTARREIHASGLRNPFRFSFDRANGDLWIGDVGQGLWEEVDHRPAGDNSGPNFGWKCYEGDAPFDLTNCTGTYVPPIAAYSHADGWCSIIGGRVYRGALYPNLQGRYLFTDYCHGRIHALRKSGSTWVQEQLTSAGSFGLAGFGEDVNGELYVCNVESGELFRVIDASAVVRVSPKLFLDGPFNASTGLMSDQLRASGLVPATEPYTALGYAQVAKGGGETVAPSVLNTTGNNAVVDWVRVELRSAARPGMVVATRQGLVQRDGDVVATDGTSPLQFTVGPGNYHVAVRHRNHLGAMTVAPVALNATAAVVDLRSASTATYGADARRSVGTQRTLWAGNVNGNNAIAYTGAGNDRDPVLVAIGGSIPTGTLSGQYRAEDVNMDGTVKYTGAGNDRDPILVSVGGALPTAVRSQQLP